MKKHVKYLSIFNLIIGNQNLENSVQIH